MRIYLSRSQTVKVVNAVIQCYGLEDPDTVNIVKNATNCLDYQCKADKKKERKKNK